ncbi:hypothetical protein WA556_005674, partial [Blastocystis sp. ATCC 50177/Nand II]
MYPSFLQSESYHECEAVLRCRELTFDTLLQHPMIVSAMADYEGSDMDSQLLCDEIALLELYRVRVEIQDPFNTYFLLSCYIDHFTKTTLSPSIQSSLLLPIQDLLSHFPYPCPFASKPPSRNSTQFIIPSVPANLPPDASTAFLSRWKVSVDAFIDSTFHTQTDLSRRFLAAANESALRTVVNCVMEMRGNRTFCSWWLLQWRLEALPLNPPSEGTLVYELPSAKEEEKEDVEMWNGTLLNGNSLLMNRIRGETETPCQTLSAPVAGAAFFVPSLPHKPAVLDRLTFQYEA